MEMLNKAYVYALAGSSRLNMEPPSSTKDEFDYGLDGSFDPVTLQDGEITPSGFSLNYQLKSTKNWRDADTHIEYRITRKAYNKMAFQNSNGVVPIILILYCLPHADECTNFHEEGMLIKKCCYYFHITGDKLPETVGSTVLHIPKANLLTPDKISSLLNQVQTEGGLQ